MDFLFTILIEINDWFSLIVVVRVTGRGPYLESPGNFSGPGKLFFVCRVCIQDQSFNNFENGTMKLSLNEAKLTGFWAGNCGTIQQAFREMRSKWGRQKPSLAFNDARKIP